MQLTYFIIFLAIASAAYGLWHWSKTRARKRQLETPLSPAQRAIVEKQVPLVHKLPPSLRKNLEGKINLFINQVEFVGCDGLEVTDDMRLSIAAQASLLVVNSDMWYDLSTILLYEGAFKSRNIQHEGYVVTEQETVRIGESWSRGPVVLSWKHSEHGARDFKDGHNVVFHEFAHQLDDSSGHTDGAPLLNKGQSFADWERAFVDAYERHLENVNRGRRTVLDEYGAEAPEEFFAVAVEVFFERADDLKQEEPEIYRQLSEFFKLDPASWS